LIRGCEGKQQNESNLKRETWKAESVHGHYFPLQKPQVLTIPKRRFDNPIWPEEQELTRRKKGGEKGKKGTASQILLLLPLPPPPGMS